MVIPLITGEFFPLSSHSMFADTHREYWQVEIKDKDNQVVPAENFHLQLNYRGLPESQRYGILPEPSHLSFGNRLTNTEIIQAIESSRDKLSSLFPLSVILSHYGQNPQGRYETLEQEEIIFE